MIILTGSYYYRVVNTTITGFWGRVWDELEAQWSEARYLIPLPSPIHVAYEVPGAWFPPDRM